MDSQPSMNYQHPGSMTSEARLRVRYAETDQMKVVYHSNYIVWFEVGRVELLRQLGFAYRDMEQDGYHLPVVEVKCRYKQPAVYDDEIIVRTHISNLRGPMVRFSYEVVRAADEVILAEGESTHFVVGNDMQRTNLPDQYLIPFRKAMGKE
jgi:acyl-CoA thioester hydrolase